MKNFKQLKIWQLGIKLVKEIYQATDKLPSSERFGLVSQMCRAAVSVPSNIAEGSSRRSEKDYIRFLEMALGSTFELETQLVILLELGFLNESDSEVAMEMLYEEQKMIQGLIRRLM